MYQSIIDQSVHSNSISGYYSLFDSLVTGVLTTNGIGFQFIDRNGLQQIIGGYIV